MPINFNPALFHTGQKANTTVELVVGGERGEELDQLFGLVSTLDI